MSTCVCVVVLAYVEWNFEMRTVALKMVCVLGHTSTRSSEWGVGLRAGEGDRG